MQEKTTWIESLIMWQASVGLAVKVCQEILNLLPSKEKYALTAQLWRSVQSIPTNIAEGYRRYHYQDNVLFCYIARGSLEKTVRHLILASKLGYFLEDVLHSYLQLTNELHRMLNGYIAFLKRSKRGENEPGSELREDSKNVNMDDHLLKHLDPPPHDSWLPNFYSPCYIFYPRS